MAAVWNEDAVPQVVMELAAALMDDDLMMMFFGPIFTLARAPRALGWGVSVLLKRPTYHPRPTPLHSEFLSAPALPLFPRSPCE